MPHAARSGAYQPFRVITAIRADGVESGEDYRGAARQVPVELLERPHGSADRSAPRAHGRARRSRPPQRLLPAAPADRAQGNQARRAAHPPLQRTPGGAGLRPARPGRRSEAIYRRAGACSRADLDDLLTCLRDRRAAQDRARHHCHRAPLARAGVRRREVPAGLAIRSVGLARGPPPGSASPT
jgi:hypothetical protein